MSGAQKISLLRAAEALLRGTGGRTVLLRMPALAVAGDVDEQVGLAVPQFQDLELGPVVFRRVLAEIETTTVTYELLVSAAAVEKLVGSLTYASAAVLLREALGVVVDETLLLVTAATEAEAFGSAYLYRLRLQGAEAVVA